METIPAGTRSHPLHSLRAAIVDDEPLGRLRIRRLLADEADVEIVGEYRDARRAAAGIHSIRPDLLFLDVQMPQGSAFTILRSLAGEHECATVLVTAHDEYALQAFEFNVVDYLLKPFDAERFHLSLQRARKRLNGTTPVLPREFAQRLAVKGKDRVHLLRVDQIDWVETAGNYVRLHIGHESFLHREPLVAFEHRLDPARFVRIHRSTVVNVDRITELQPSFRRDHVVVLCNGTRLTLSAPYRARFQEIVGRF